MLSVVVFEKNSNTRIIDGVSSIGLDAFPSRGIPNHLEATDGWTNSRDFDPGGLPSHVSRDRGSDLAPGVCSMVIVQQDGTYGVDETRGGYLGA